METSTKKTTLASGQVWASFPKNEKTTHIHTARSRTCKAKQTKDKRKKEKITCSNVETNGQIDKEPLPTAVIPPYEHLPPNHNNVSTEPLPSAVIPPFEHIPSSHSETLNTLSELDLGDINIDLFGDTNLDLLGDPYMNS